MGSRCMSGDSEEVRVAKILQNSDETGKLLLNSISL
jgi:hypothetical protein